MNKREVFLKEKIEEKIIELKNIPGIENVIYSDMEPEGFKEPALSNVELTRKFSPELFENYELRDLNSEELDEIFDPLPQNKQWVLIALGCKPLESIKSIWFHPLLQTFEFDIYNDNLEMLIQIMIDAYNNKNKS